MKRITILTGAGISAESGIKTFRDSGGLWEQYDIMEVASIEGWHKNKKLMIQFYNERRTQLATVQPNKGHRDIVELEKNNHVHIITQNVDDLHERAGSKNILHLHGELTKVRSEGDETDIRDIGYGTIKLGDKCSKGFQLRPHIVWFGEQVPEIEKAVPLVHAADIFLIVGTSLNVYPAAGLIQYAPKTTPVVLIDPGEFYSLPKNTEHIKLPATQGVELFITQLNEGKYD